jgi:hypothetical protein
MGRELHREMVEKSRVAAYGDVKYVVEYLNPGDIVFFYHKGPGIVAAGEVSGWLDRRRRGAISGGPLPNSRAKPGEGY